MDTHMHPHHLWWGASHLRVEMQRVVSVGEVRSYPAPVGLYVSLNNGDTREQRPEWRSAHATNLPIPAVHLYHCPFGGKYTFKMCTETIQNQLKTLVMYCSCSVPWTCMRDFFPAPVKGLFFVQERSFPWVFISYISSEGWTAELRRTILSEQSVISSPL